MNLGRMTKALAPIIAVVLAGTASGCSAADATINGEKGKRLAELDLTGPAPAELVLLGPDTVEVTAGDRLAITVDGDPAAVERLRFTHKDGTLAIAREGKSGWRGGTARVLVTMPVPRKVEMLGSGTIRTPALAPDAEVTVAGSGTVEAGRVSGRSLEVSLPGSGSFSAAGSVGALELEIMGSGSARLEGLQVERAKVEIAGSGDAAFASDGEVRAEIMGSGTVTVKGRPRCTVSAAGSGKLICGAAAQ